MSCKYKVQGESFDNVSEAREYRDGVYGESSKREVQRIQSLIPNVPVKVIKGLINRDNTLADGMFENQLITLSDTATEGVGYHEAFHAISQMFLTETERSELYEKAYPQLSPAEAEEALADDFKLYMLNGEKRGFLQKLFDGIVELINYYFKGGKDRIFRKARKGKYKNLKLSSTSQTLFNKISMNHIEKYDMTELLAYKAISTAGLLDKGDLSFSDWDSTWEEVINEIKDIRETLSSEIKSLAKQRKSDPTSVSKDTLSFKASLANRYMTVLNEKDSFEKLTLELLDARGLTKDAIDTVDQSEEGVVKQSDKNIDSSLKASGLTKLILSTMVDTESLNPTTQQPSLVDFNEVYHVLSRELADVVETENLDGDKLSQSIDILTRLSGKRKYLNNLIKLLQKDDVSENTKIHLINNFANQKIIYTTTINDFNTGSVKHINADSSSQSAMLLDSWSTKNEKLTPVQLKNLVGEDGAWNKIKEEYNKVKLPIGSTQTNNFLKRVSVVLNKLGVSVSEYDLMNYVESGKGSVYSQIMTSKDSLNGAISYPKYANSLINQIYERQESNPLKNKAFRRLAQIITDNSDTVSDGSVYFDGKSYYPIALNNNQSKTLSRFKQDRTLITKRRQHLFHKHSRWLKEMESMEDIDNVVIQEFLAESYPEDDFIKSKSYGQLNGTSDIISRINRLTMGYYQIPTLAEKKTFPQIKGLTQERVNTAREGAPFLINYIIAEAERIQWAFNNEDTVNKVDVYSKKALEFQLFPSLNNNSELMSAIKNEEGIPFDEDGFTELFLDTAEKALTDNINNHIDYLTEVGMIMQENAGTSIVGLNSEAQARATKYAKETTIEGKLDTVTPALADAVLNSIIGNVEFMMVFAGDPAFYKDITKRSIATSSTGVDNYLLTNSVEPIAREYNMVVVEDNVVKSKRIDDYGKMIRAKYADFNFTKSELDAKVKSELAAYENMDEGDALGVSSPSRYRDIMRMQALWPVGADEVYDILMSDDPTLEIPYDKMELMSSIKGHYFGLNEKPIDLEGVSEPATPVFVKYSLFPLFPRLVKGTKYQKVYDSMAKHDTQEVVFASGVKAGATDILDLTNKKNSTVEDGVDTFNYSNMVLDNMNWKLQQPTSNKLNTVGSASEASQHQKNLTANVNLSAKIYDNETKTGQEAIDHINELGEALSKWGYEKYTKQWGLSNDKLSDRKKFYDNLISKLVEDGKVSDYQLDQLRRGAPLDSIMSLGSGIEMDALAALNKASVKTKMPGAPLVQISSYGFSKMEAFDLTSLSEKGGIKWFKNIDVLEGSHVNKDGKFNRAQVLIPHMKMKELREKHSETIAEVYGGKTVDELSGAELSEIFNSSLEGVIGYRIPGQGFASVDTFEVVGILPEGMGDSIITYQDVVGKTGSDFDIDKMYLMMHNLRFNKKTKNLEKIPYDSDPSPEGIRRRWKKASIKNFTESENEEVQEVVNKLKDQNKEIKAVLDPLLSTRDEIAEEYKELQLELVDATGEDIKDIKDFIKVNKSQMRDVVTKIKSIKEKFVQIGPEIDGLIETIANVSEKSLLLEDFASLPIPQQNTLQAVQNEKLRMYDQLLQTHSGEAVTPIDADWLANDAKIKHVYRSVSLEHVKRIKKEPKVRTDVEIAKEAFDRTTAQLEEFTNMDMDAKLNWMKSNIDVMNDLEFYTLLNQAKVKEANTVGLVGTGVAANHVSHHPIGQQKKFFIDVDLGFGKIDLSKIRNDEGYITDSLNAYINAFVDNVKDPFLARINNNEITSNAGFLLLRSGVDPKWVNSFLHQPIIHEYVAFKRDQSSPVKRSNKPVSEKIKSKGYKITDHGEIIFARSSSFEHVPMDLEAFALSKGYTIEQLVNTDISESLDISILDNGIKSGIGNKNTQRKILVKFITALKLGEELAEAIAVSRTDTQGVELNGIEGRSILKRRDDIINRNVIQNVGEAWAEGTALATKTKFSIEKAMTMFEEELLSFAPGTWATVLETIDSLQIFDTQDNRNDISKYFKTYIASGSNLFNMSKEQHREILDTTPALFQKFQKENPNLFLSKTLTTTELKSKTVQDKVLHIQAPRGRILPHQLNQLTEDWENLFTDDTLLEGTEFRNRDVAQKLLLYMFATNGGNKAFNSYENIIPPNILALSGYEAHMKLAVKGLQTVTVDSNFIQQYALNFPDKLKFKSDKWLSKNKFELSREGLSLNPSSTEDVPELPNIFTNGIHVFSRVTDTNNWVKLGKYKRPTVKRGEVYFNPDTGYAQLSTVAERNVEKVSITDEGVIEDLGASLGVNEVREESAVGETITYQAVLKIDGKSQKHSPSLSATYKTKQEAFNAGKKVLLAFNKEKLNQIIKGC